MESDDPTLDDVVAKAAKFAERSHASIDQRRKYTNEPYIVHPAEVARLVSAVTDDAITIAAAWLHDVIEDTPVTLEDVCEEFGVEIAGLVGNLTNVSCKSDGNRKTRKRIDRERLAKADPRAQTIKLADIIHNMTDIANHDPDFAHVYVLEKELALDVLMEGSPSLLQRARTLVAKLKADLADT